MEKQAFVGGRTHTKTGTECHSILNLHKSLYRVYWARHKTQLFAVCISRINTSVNISLRMNVEGIFMLFFFRDRMSFRNAFAGFRGMCVSFKTGIIRLSKLPLMLAHAMPSVRFNYSICSLAAWLHYHLKPSWAVKYYDSTNQKHFWHRLLYEEIHSMQHHKITSVKFYTQLVI